MPSMIAFAEVEELVPGQVLPIDRYLVEPRELWKLGHGGTLYLVALGPKKALYLVAALEQPERSRIKKGDKRPDGWYAPVNTVPVTDITKLRRALKVDELPMELTAAAEAKLRATFDDEDAPVIAATAAPSTLVAAIDELIVIWRRTRDVGVADLVERATRLLPRFDRPFLVDTRDDLDSYKRWMKAWKDERAEAMPQLLQHLTALRYHIDELVDVIAKAPDDPRIARTLARHVLTGRPGWAPIVERSRDATAWTEIAAIHDELDEYRIPGIQTSFAFAARRPNTSPLTADERARVDAIAQSLVPDTAEQTLIDAIAEHADDDEPYLIYSDWLLERGHPRGEYIALACQKQRSGLSAALARRLAALERVPFMFGALDGPATTWQRPRPRGIDRVLDVYASTTNLAWREVAQHPLARALERINFIGAPKRQRVAGIAALARAAPRLRQIDGLSAGVGNALVKALGAEWRWDGESLVRKR